MATKVEVKEKRRWRIPGRVPVILLALLSLLAALWAGLTRLGWPLPALPVAFAGQHGAFMVSGFLGTVISLERAVALRENRGKSALTYGPPLLAGLGALLLLLGQTVAGQAAITLGSLGLVVVFGVIVRMQPDRANGTMAVGALLWLVGNGLWLAGVPVYRAVPWWAGFLILTVAGERLELARVLRWGHFAQQAFLAATGVFLAGLLLSLVAFDAGVRVAGVGLLALGLWLLRYDVARRTVRRQGLTRFIAVCLLLGYGWLLVGGGLWLGYGGTAPAGPVYDAMLHTLFLGFVFSMIFGHAPIIIPAVLRVPVPYRPGFYVHLALLHLSLVLRVVGDLAFRLPWRQWGGLLNEVALLLFLAVTVYAVRSGRGERRL